MREAGLVEGVPDGTHPPVHHIGGGDDVAAGARLNHRLLPKDLDGLVVLDIAVANDPVMPVRGERVERHIAQHAQLGQRLLQGRNRAADQIAGVERVAALRIL